MADLSTLNPQQLKAVTTIDGPLLIIAGAGSGKTGVITHRIAYMLESGIPQSHLLALTFTNKAASEMEERIKKLTGKKLSNLTVLTFHAFGVKILKEKSHLMGWRQNFSIYDSSDQLEVIKEAGRELDMSFERDELKTISHIFSSIKTGTRIWGSDNHFYKELYSEYNDFLKLKNAFDFDDLITKPIDLFEHFPEVLVDYQRRYHYIMVDEFQDTSMVQYRLVQMISLAKGNICCVGDDDQSIYSWRGANYENIVNFERDFPDREEIILERNYRSTGNILKAANSIIINNSNRKDKKLWTEERSGEAAIQLRFLKDDSEESEFICSKIKSLRALENKEYQDFGILVRTNSLMDGLEEALIRYNIPHSISGGSSFFDRREVKDIIAYLKIVDNHDDDISMMRIINTPRRGVGKKALEDIRAYADARKITIYQALKALTDRKQQLLLEVVTTSPLVELLEIIDNYTDKLAYGKEMAASARELLEDINYWDYLIQDCSSEKEALWRYDNILRFFDFFDRWAQNPDNLDPKLNTYLTRITLSSREDNEDKLGKVSLMTIHAAKGLEFPVTFLAGVENNIIPHARSIAENPANIEEERRLFYVAVTRAKQKLFMTVCRKRKSMLEMAENDPSPFLTEIPIELIETEELDDNEENSNSIAINLFNKFLKIEK